MPIAGNLNSHVRLVHSGDSTFSCDQCDFTSATRKDLREHQRSHNTKGSCKCPDCDYACVSRSALRLHAKVHMTDKPHHCTSCSYASKHAGNLRAHIRKKHDSATNVRVAGDSGRLNSKKPRPRCKAEFTCNVCGEGFVRVDSLRSHQRHHRENQLNCQRQQQLPTSTGVSDGTLWQVAQDRLGSAALYTLSVQSLTPTSATTSVYSAQSPVTTVPTIVSSAVNVNSASATIRPQLGLSPNVLWMRPGLQGGGTLQETARQSNHTSRQQQAANAMAFRENHQNLAVEDNRQNMEAARATEADAAIGSIVTSQDSTLSQLQSLAVSTCENSSELQTSVLAVNTSLSNHVIHPQQIAPSTGQTYVLQTVGDNNLPITVELPHELGPSAGNTYIQLINENGIIQNVLLPPQPPAGQFVYHFIPPAEPVSMSLPGNTVNISVTSESVAQSHLHTSTVQPLSLYQNPTASVAGNFVEDIVGRQNHITLRDQSDLEDGDKHRQTTQTINDRNL